MQSGMLRITPTFDRSDRLHLNVEGRLTDRTAEDLVTSCEQGFASEREIALDLSGLTFVDPDGLEALARLIARGAVPLRCTPFLEELLRRR